MSITENAIRAQTNAGVVAVAAEAAAEASQKPQMAPGVDHAKPFIILGGQVVYLDERFEEPARKTGIVKMRDIESFVEYYKQFASITAATGVSPRVYANLDPVQFTAVFNDHGNKPGYRDHRAVYTPKFSTEWETWVNHDHELFDDQVKFGEFVENNAPDIVSPAGAEMLEIALNLRVLNNVSFKNSTRLSDGNLSLEYSEIVDAQSSAGGQNVKVPELFKISIPVFEGIDQPLYEMEGRLRIRVGQARAKMWFDLVRPHKVKEAAFKAMLETLKAGVGGVLFGSPE